MSRLAEWEQRQAQYGPQAPVIDQYSSALVRQQRQSVGVPLTKGQKVFREITYFAVGGVALKGLGLGLRGIDWYLKGSRGTTFVRRGKLVHAFRDTGTGRIISKSAHRRNPGLLPRTTKKYSEFKAAERKAKKFLRGVPVLGTAIKFRSRIHFIRDPVLWTAKRVPGLGLGIGAYGLWKRYGHLLDSNGNGPNPEQPDRVKLVFNQYDGAGEPLPPRVQPSLSRQRHRKLKSTSRCPPGHRWSSKLKKCVRYRRRR